MWRTAEAIAHEARRLAASGALPPVPFELGLPGGTTLVGTLTDRTADGVVAFQFSRVRAKHLLAMWVRHLACCAVAPDDGPCRSVLIGRALANKNEKGKRIKKEVSLAYDFAPVEDAVAQLARWVELMRAGRDAPLAMAPDTTLTYGKALHDHIDERIAMRMASSTWFGFEAGEKKFDAHLRRVFGELEPPFAEAVAAGPPFAELAREVVLPMLAHSKPRDL